MGELYQREGTAGALDARAVRGRSHLATEMDTARRTQHGGAVHDANHAHR